MATRAIRIEDRDDYAAGEFLALANRVETALAAERRAQRRLVQAIDSARVEGERQRRALNG